MISAIRIARASLTVSEQSVQCIGVVEYDLNCKLRLRLPRILIGIHTSVRHIESEGVGRVGEKIDLGSVLCRSRKDESLQRGLPVVMKANRGVAVVI